MEKSAELLNGLQVFTGQEFLSDVTVKVEDVTYKAHKVVLAAASQYFYKIFQDPDQDVIELPEPILPKSQVMKSKDVFLTVLRYMYSNQSVSVLTPDNLNAATSFTIFSVAHLLEIRTLVEFTGKFISELVLNNENGADILYEGIKYNSENLIESGLDKIVKNFEMITHKPSGLESLTNLPYEFIKNICENDGLNVKSEGILYGFVCSYIQKRESLIEIKDEEKEEESKEEKKDEKSYKEEKKGEKKDEKSSKEEKLSKEEVKRSEEKKEAKKPEDNKEDQPKVLEKSLKDIAADKLKLKKLTDQEKFELLETVRWPFLTHAELLQAATNSLIAVGKDLVLEGLSVQLSAHEKSTKGYSYKVQQKPRNVYSDPKTDEDVKERPVKSTDNDTPDRARTSANAQDTWQWPTQFLRQSLPNFGSKSTPPKPPQKFSQTFKAEKKPELPAELVYSYDFDENGAIYFLATNGKTQAWSNPHLSGQIQVFASSIGYGQLEDFVGRTVTNLRTLNEIGSFIGIDFGPGKLLVPTAYTIRNRNSSSHVCLNWQLEGSTNKTDWTVLDRRIHYSGDIQYDSNLEADRQTLKQRGATSTWGIDITANDLKTKSFRCFRIVQIDRNSSGSYNLALSGFEIYGFATGRWVN